MFRTLAFSCSLVVFATVLTTASEAHADFTKGPWVIDVDEESARVLVELPEVGVARLELTSPNAESMSVESASSLLHIIGVSSLTPGTPYQFTVVSGETRAEGSFRTAPSHAGDETIRFLAYGDNRTDHVAHREVVAHMLTEPNVRLLVHTGDMVETSTAENWQFFFDIERELLKDRVLMPALGNHELYGLGGRDLYRAYMAPARPNGPDYYARSYGALHFIALDSNDLFDPPGPQFEWLRDELTRARQREDTRWIIVSTHHSPRSSGLHDDHQGMVDAGVLDLFREHEVDLIFAGHDHGYERGDADGVKYIVAGGGGAPLYPVNREHPGQLAFQSVHHYCVVDAGPERLEVRVVKRDGEVLERCGFAHGETWACENGSAQGPVEGITALEFWVRLRWQRYLLYTLLVVLVLLWWRRRRMRARADGDKVSTDGA